MLCTDYAIVAKIDGGFSSWQVFLVGENDVSCDRAGGFEAPSILRMSVFSCMKATRLPGKVLYQCFKKGGGEKATRLA